MVRSAGNDAAGPSMKLADIAKALEPASKLRGDPRSRAQSPKAGFTAIT